MKSQKDYTYNSDLDNGTFETNTTEQNWTKEESKGLITTLILVVLGFSLFVFLVKKFVF